MSLSYQDAICLFAQECLHATDNPDDRLGLAVACGAYRRWAKKARDRPNMNYISFKLAMMNYAGMPETKRTGADISNVWLGLILVE